MNTWFPPLLGLTKTSRGFISGEGMGRIMKGFICRPSCQRRCCSARILHSTAMTINPPRKTNHVHKKAIYFINLKACQTKNTDAKPPKLFWLIIHYLHNRMQNGFSEWTMRKRTRCRTSGVWLLSFPSQRSPVHTVCSQYIHWHMRFQGVMEYRAGLTSAPFLLLFLLNDVLFFFLLDFMEDCETQNRDRLIWWGERQDVAIACSHKDNHVSLHLHKYIWFTSRLRVCLISHPDLILT